MATNEAIPFYEDGDAITATCAAAVSGKTFVAITASRPYGPGFSLTSTDTSGGNVVVETAAAGGRKFGVAAFDQPTIGQKVTVLRAPGLVVPVVAGLAIAAFEEVSVGAGGKAVPRTWIAGIKATAKTGVVASNDAITWEAGPEALGDEGNNVKVILKYTKAANTALAVAVVDSVITVTLSTEGAEKSSAKASAIIKKIEETPAAAALVVGKNTGASTGAGIVEATEEVQLSEGRGAGLTKEVGYVLSAANENEDAQVHIY